MSKLVTGTHRISYVHLKEPSAIEGGTPRYNLTILIDKDHEDVAKINKIRRELYDANKESLFKGLPFTSTKLWNPLRDGDEWLEEHPDAVEYEGKYFLRVASKTQPAVFNRDKQEIFDLDEVYSGSYARAALMGYAYNNQSKGFGFFLNSVMWMKDGERLGGFTASADDYGDDDEQDDDLT